MNTSVQKEKCDIVIDKRKQIKNDLKNWRAIVKQYQQPNNKKAAIQIINSFTLSIAISFLMFYTFEYSIFLTLLLGLINGFALCRIFIIQHDCGHQSFSKSTKINNGLGFLCSCFSTLPYKYWSKVHSHHHGHAGQYESRSIGDINFMTVEEYKKASNFKRLKYRIFRHIFVILFVVPIGYFLVNNRLPLMEGKVWDKANRSQFFNNITIVSLYTAITLFLGLQFLYIQLISVYFFSIIAFWFFYVQHQHEFTYMQPKKDWDYLLAAIQGSSYYKLPHILNWFTGNIGFHHIHHLNSLIPNYNLKICYNENPILSKHINIITISKSFKCVNANLWDEETQRMISFRQMNLKAPNH